MVGGYSYSYISIFSIVNAYLIFRTPRPIIDQEDRIIGALAGQPRDPSWSHVEKDASHAIRDAGEKASFNKKQAKR